MRNSISTTVRLFIVAISATFMVALAGPAQAAVPPSVYLSDGGGPHNNEICIQSGYVAIEGASLPHNGSYAVTFGSVVLLDSGAINSVGDFVSLVDRNRMKGKVTYQVYVFDSSGNFKFSKSLVVKWIRCTS